MSKLTNWLDDEELDVQSIVDKYEKELVMNQSPNSSHLDNHKNDDLEIWSESIDDNGHINLSKQTVNKPNDNDLDNQSVKFRNVPPPPPPSFKPNINANVSKPSYSSNKTINFGVNDQVKFSKPSTPPPPPPPIKKPVDAKKQSTILFNYVADNHQDDNDIVDVKKVDTKILKTNNSTKPLKHNTITFKHQTAELSNQEQKQQNATYFNDQKDFLKTLKENDYKTVKFNSVDDDGIYIDNKKKEVEKEPQIEKKNCFNDSLTSIFFNETQKAENLDLTKEINQAEAFDININKNKKKRKNDSKNDEKNKYKTKIPNFIKRESRFLLTNIVLSTTFFLGTLALISYVLFIYLSQGFSIYLMIPATSLSLLGIYSIIANAYRYHRLHKEIKGCDYEINKELPLLSLKKIYKRLIVANINLNWACLLIYSLCGFGILLTFIVTYFMNLVNNQVNDFSNLYYNNDPTPLINVWSQAAVVFTLIPVQIAYNLINKKRMSDINLFYQKEILSDELVLKYQKDARRKWKIIYFTIIAVVGLIVLITYLVLRKKAKK